MKFIVLNVEHREDRRWLFTGAAHIMGVANADIHFAISPKPSYYENNFIRLREAAADDGFDFIKNYGLGLRNDWAGQTPGSFCQTWLYCKIFRYLTESGETACVTHDDRVLTIRHELLMEDYRVLKNRCQNFYMWQLRIRQGDDVSNALENDELRTLFKSIYCNQPFHRAFFFNHLGLDGYEETMIYSPSGAAWVLSELASARGDYIFYDNFIKEYLSQNCIKHLKLGAGIYCPKSEAYPYITEIAHMGTDTHWAHEKTYKQQAERQTEFNYLRL